MTEPLHTIALTETEMVLVALALENTARGLDGDDVKALARELAGRFALEAVS